jgi:excisionase family DNA binding protein
VTSPYLRTDEACDYLRYAGKHRLRSLYRFIQRAGIRTARRGRRVLVVKADLDRAIGAAVRKAG